MGGAGISNTEVFCLFVAVGLRVLLLQHLQHSEQTPTRQNSGPTAQQTCAKTVTTWKHRDASHGHIRTIRSLYARHVKRKSGHIRGIRDENVCWSRFCVLCE